jgi:hypothetical protein
VIPEIVNLLDSMKDTDSPNQPTATAALAYFEEICGILTEEDLEHSVEATRWISGVCTLVHMGMYGVYSCRSYAVPCWTSCVLCTSVAYQQ